MFHVVPKGTLAPALSSTISCLRTAAAAGCCAPCDDAVFTKTSQTVRGSPLVTRHRPHASLAARVHPGLGRPLQLAGCDLCRNTLHRIRFHYAVGVAADRVTHPAHSSSTISTPHSPSFCLHARQCREALPSAIPNASVKPRAFYSTWSTPPPDRARTNRYKLYPRFRLSKTGTRVSRCFRWPEGPRRPTASRRTRSASAGTLFRDGAIRPNAIRRTEPLTLCHLRACRHLARRRPTLWPRLTPHRPP